MDVVDGKSERRKKEAFSSVSSPFSLDLSVATKN